MFSSLGHHKFLVFVFLCWALISTLHADQVAYDLTGNPGPLSKYWERGFWSVELGETGLRVSKPADDGSTFRCDDTAKNPYSTAGVESTFTVDGDFTVSVDYDWQQIVTPSFSKGLTEAVLLLTPITPPSYSIGIYNLRNDLGNHFTTFFVSTPEGMTVGTLFNAPESGILKFQRINNVLSAYATDASGIETLVGSDDISEFAGPMQIKVQGRQGQQTHSCEVIGNERRDPMEIEFRDLSVEADVITPSIAGSESGFSGLFYDPENSGHGFDINKHKEGLVVFYYGHTASGERLWLISETSQVDLNLDQVVKLEMYEITNGSFGAPDGGTTPWGDLYLEFIDCNTAEALLTGFDGTIEVPLSRLTGLEATICESGDLSDAYTLEWTNQNVTLYRDSNGVVGDLSATAFDFAVYKGNKRLQAISPGASLGAGQWSLTLTGNENITPDDDPYTPAPVNDVVKVDPISWIGSSVTSEQIRIDLNIEGAPWTPLYQSINVSTPSRAYSVVGSNLEHTFLCDANGAPYSNDFSNWFQVRSGGASLEYDGTVPYGPNTYHYENWTWSSNLDMNSDGSGLDPIFINPVVRNGVMAGEILLNGSSHYLGEGPLDETAWIDVPIHDEFGNLITAKVITLKKQ
jgi:hypothetical protein